MNSIILITQLCSCRAEELQEVIEVHFRSAEELYKPLSSLFFFFLFFFMSAHIFVHIEIHRKYK